MLIQTLFAQPAVEAFDVCVFHRLSRTDERQIDAMFVRPLATIAAGIASRPNCLEHELRCAPLSLGRWLSTLSQPVSSSV